MGNLFYKLIGSRIGWFVVMLAGLLLVSGCATKMPLNSKESKVDLAKGSLVLFALEMENEYVPDYQPKVKSVHFASLEDEQSSMSFDPGVELKKTEAGGNFYLVSAVLKPGQYKFQNISCGASSLLIYGNCIAHIDSKFPLKENEIIYLGHISAKNIERKEEGAKWAGPLIPLIDQAVTGFSGGTFKIKMENKLDEDRALFVENYPDLSHYDIHYVAMEPTE